jgi:predicted homoserine dehydrogenase-like protein
MSIKVAIIGMGSMGRGLLYQIEKTPGIKCVAITDLDINKCIQYAEKFGKKSKIINDSASCSSNIRNGNFVIAKKPEFLAECETIDVIIESSSAIVDGLRYSEIALENKKHLILMNSEVDLTFGTHLLNMAKNNGVTYTSCDGDQHGVIKKLVDEIELWNFKLVMAGNIKGFLDKYSNPQKIISEANKRNLDYKMATSYTDGTKLAIEMALVSNALGLRPNKGKMTGPKAEYVKDVLKLFNFNEIMEGLPVVDYVLGAEPGGGVFVVGYCDDIYQMDMMKYYKMGNGPYYLFYRPYHLCHIESMRCIFDAVQGKSLLKPDCGMMTNVYSCAKTDLGAGSKLDGVGGYTCYGIIQERNDELLPICLSENTVLAKSIKKDQIIKWNDVRLESKVNESILKKFFK